MSGNLRIIFDNISDTASLTATSEALPIDYVKRAGRSYTWRSTDVGEQTINGTFASPSYINSLAVLRHNISASGTVRIEFLLSGSVVYDSGDVFPSELKPLGEWVVGVDPWGTSSLSLLPTQQFVIWLDNVILADSYRITINDASNPDGYIQVGRIFAGEYYSPEINAEYGLQLEWQDFGENRRTESGSLRTINTGFARRVSFGLDILSPQEFSRLTLAVARTPKENDIYINIYPEQGGVLEASHAFLAKRESNYQTVNNQFDSFSNQLTFNEV